MISGGLGRTDANFPGYCSWMPFADYLEACQIPSPSQLIQDEGTRESYCRMFPEDCKLVQYASENPTMSALVGPSLGESLSIGGQIPSWILLVGAGLLFIMVVRR